MTPEDLGKEILVSESFSGSLEVPLLSIIRQAGMTKEEFMALV
ncbi:MAG: hypothetical protein AABX13_01510 [Nanoarchaeota archaeon]